MPPRTRVDPWTDQALADLAGYRAECPASGLATSPVDRAAAEAAVRRLYRAGGRAEPRLIIWMGSPLGGVFAAALIPVATPGAADPLRRECRRDRGEVRPLLRHKLAGRMHRQLHVQLRHRQWQRQWCGLSRRLWHEPVDTLLQQVRDQLPDQLHRQLTEALDDDELAHRFPAELVGRLRGQLWDELGSPHGEQLRNTIHGGGDLAVLGCCHAARRLGVRYDRQLDEHLNAMLATTGLGWWWPYPDVAILTERPTQLHRDGQGRLHHDNGPAAIYPDGWTVHAWHGTRMPASFSTWTVSRILSEPNVEVRRCAIERLGWDRFIGAADLAQIGTTAPDPGNPGNTLALHDVPGRIYRPPVRVLLCTNGTLERDGTRRRFGLTVPAHIADPIEAAAWGYGLTATQYTQARRRT